MTKPRISKVFDMSKYLGTKSGIELRDVLLFISEFVNDFIACVTNGLSYQDNFDCEYKTVSLFNGRETIVGISKPTKRVTEIRVRQVVDDFYYIVDSFGWKYNSDGNLVVTIVYFGSTPANFNPQVNLIVYYS